MVIHELHNVFQLICADRIPRSGGQFVVLVFLVKSFPLTLRFRQWCHGATISAGHVAMLTFLFSQHFAFFGIASLNSRPDKG